MFGDLAREKQAACRLNLARRQSGLFVVSRHTARFGRDSFKDIVDERIHSLQTNGLDNHRQTQTKHTDIA
jgi:hypothetical protein